MKIAAITPVYNSAATLPAALASMAAQTRRPDEIWLIDDASSEAVTRSYLQSLGKDYAGIPLHIIFQKSNQGAGAARNRALAATLCEVVAFLDADDAWLPNHLATAEAALESSGAIFVASNFYQIDAQGNKNLVDCFKRFQQPGGLHKGNPQAHLFYRGFIGMLTVVAQRQALIKAGGLDARRRHTHDWGMWHAALMANPDSQFLVLEQPSALYHVSPNSLTSKTWPRMLDREAFLPQFVKAAASVSRVWWPILLLRGWLTVQYETIVPLFHKKDWRKIVHLFVRAPVVLVKLYAQTMCPQSPRPNFLAPPWLENK